MKETIARLRKWLTGWMTGGPHFVVGPHDRPYLLRWYVLPRNDWLNVYLHKFCRDDDDRALHDHPWPSLSLVLWGGYVEQTRTAATSAGEHWTAAKGVVTQHTHVATEYTYVRKWYGIGSLLRRAATHTHRIELPGGKPCWTLFITGPRVREWGFHCPKGWVHWRDFTASHDVGQVGKGCDQ